MRTDSDDSNESSDGDYSLQSSYDEEIAAEYLEKNEKVNNEKLKTEKKMCDHFIKKSADVKRQLQTKLGNLQGQFPRRDDFPTNLTMIEKEMLQDISEYKNPA